MPKIKWMWESELRLMGEMDREGLFSSGIVSGVILTTVWLRCIFPSLSAASVGYFWFGVNDVEQIILKDILDAPLQARLCNNMQKARELWDNIMTKGNAKYANMWLEYYNLERWELG